MNRSLPLRNDPVMKSARSKHRVAPPKKVELKYLNKFNNKRSIFSSVTRFGKIKKSFYPLLEQLFSIWKNCEPTMANISYLWANFPCYKWPNIEIII